MVVDSVFNKVIKINFLLCIILLFIFLDKFVNPNGSFMQVPSLQILLYPINKHFHLILNTGHVFPQFLAALRLPFVFIPMFSQIFINLCVYFLQIGNLSVQISYYFNVVAQGCHGQLIVKYLASGLFAAVFYPLQFSHLLHKIFLAYLL